MSHPTKFRQQVDLVVIPVFEFRDYGDLYTMEAFTRVCVEHKFTNDDGHGRYATERGESMLRIVPSDVLDFLIRPGFTHVKWYNR